MCWQQERLDFIYVFLRSLSFNSETWFWRSCSPQSTIIQALLQISFKEAKKAMNLRRGFIIVPDAGSLSWLRLLVTAPWTVNTTVFLFMPRYSSSFFVFVLVVQHIRHFYYTMNNVWEAEQAATFDANSKKISNPGCSVSIAHFASDASSNMTVLPGPWNLLRGLRPPCLSPGHQTVTTLWLSFCLRHFGAQSVLESFLDVFSRPSEHPSSFLFFHLTICFTSSLFLWFDSFSVLNPPIFQVLFWINYGLEVTSKWTFDKINYKLNINSESSSLCR